MISTFWYLRFYFLFYFFRDFSYQSLTSIQPLTLDNFTKLEILNFENNQFTIFPLHIFDYLTALTTLGLQSNLFTTLQAGIFDKLKALTYLNLWDNYITTVPADIFFYNNNLTQLFLSHNPWDCKSCSVKMLGHLPAYTNTSSKYPAYCNDINLHKDDIKTGADNCDAKDDQLAIIVGASVGGVVLSIVVAFLIWKYPCHCNCKQRRKNISYTSF